MKICKLKLKNLNSFREAVEIDFENPPLDDASLVAITGPTGSGKTTLLDAICVALYGRTPRLSGTGSQNPNHLISHGEKEAFAEVLFMANGTRYLATWSIRQKGAPKVQLFYADDAKLISDKLSTRGKSLGSSQNTVSEEVESILGLDFDAFRRSVMLAQGEFAAFLKASNEERRTILEATAGISIYEALKHALNDKVSTVEAASVEVAKKLEGIPPASREQLIATKKELDSLEKDVDTLKAQAQQIQQKKERETKRIESFEQLEASKEKQETLLAQQPVIEALRAEQEAANRARHLLPEKQMFDTASSDLEETEKAYRIATTEKTDAEEQIEADQAVFNEKEAAYVATSTKRDQKVEVYTDAKSDVERAEERFAEADKRGPELTDLSNQIDTLENQLDSRWTEQAQFQKQIEDAQHFFERNRLPSDRQSRLNRATGLLVQLGSQENQLETTLTSKAHHEKKVASSKREIKKLSDTHTEHLSEKADAVSALENAEAELNKLLTTGTREEWTARKQKAVKAQPISQKYEATTDDLVDTENQLNVFNDTGTVLEVELEQTEAQLANQTEVCQHAAEAVQRCEMERESARWANPINQLRQRLQPGEPCSVCGATDHPCADVVEPESEERLQRAEDAWADAKAGADEAHAQLQALKTRQAEIKRDERNNAKQIENCDAKIEVLRNQKSQLLAQWQEVYPDTDVSPGWTTQRIDKADTAITSLGEAEKAHAQAAHACRIASQQLETCENNIAHETKSLNETEQQLRNFGDAVADLQADTASTEDRLWELLPSVFHGVTPAEAVKHFTDKIAEVEKREGEQDTAKTQLQLLNTNIEADQGRLKELVERYVGVQAEIDEYQREGEVFLNAIREKTDGLETAAEIDEAIDKLKAESQARETERDQAEQRLQDSRSLFTQKETAHEICKNRREESGEKFDNAYKTYADKLRDAGFDSLEAHNNAFRDETQMQELTERVDRHADEMQQLTLEMTELQTRFEESPFDPDALGRIEAELNETETLLQGKQQEVGAQQQKIDDLKDALQKREALGDEMQAAQQELERWQRLQETIPANTLRDFALEIMFRQMGSLANEQLKYLTSERYQLKVETIGDLAVIDRWNANEERPVETLSGGESFLTSLALALALSELSRGRSQLNSLFLDEGFGTLDAETLDIAIAALEGLRMQGRNIFLISHIQELTRRLPVKINVNKQGNGSSSVKIQG